MMGRNLDSKYYYLNLNKRFSAITRKVHFVRLFKRNKKLYIILKRFIKFKYCR